MTRLIPLFLALALAGCANNGLLEAAASTIDRDQEGCAWVVDSNTGFDGRRCDE